MSNSIGLIESKGLVALIEAADVILKNSPVKILGIHKLNNGLITLVVLGDADYVKAAVDSGAEAGRRVGEIYSFSVIENPAAELLNIFSEFFPEGNIAEKIADGNISLKIQPTVEDIKDASALFASVAREVKPESKREKSKPLEITRLNQIHKIKKNSIKKKSDTISKIDESLQKNIIDANHHNEEKDETDAVEKPLSTIERLRIEALGTGIRKTKIVDRIATNKKKNKETNKINLSSEEAEIDFDLISQMNVHKLRNYARKFSYFPIKGREISRANRDELVELFNTFKK
ncbi:MAG TPA: hypothetical protein DHV28_18245 [Ignavibacteriales bacterium]|nr:hypothetical protein [Ignavibacteriales bacterium]